MATEATTGLFSKGFENNAMILGWANLGLNAANTLMSWDQYRKNNKLLSDQLAAANEQRAIENARYDELEAERKANNEYISSVWSNNDEEKNSSDTQNVFERL